MWKRCTSLAAFLLIFLARSGLACLNVKVEDGSGDVSSANKGRSYGGQRSLTDLDELLLKLKYPSMSPAATTPPVKEKKKAKNIHGRRTSSSVKSEAITLKQAARLFNESLCGSKDDLNSFCADPTKYPIEEAEQSLKKIKLVPEMDLLMRMLTPDASILAQPSQSRNPAVKSIFSSSERDGQSGLEDLETAVCGSYWSYVFPKRAKNKNGEYKFILNSPKPGELAQGVRIVVCLGANEPCNFGGYTDFVSRLLKTVCKQQFNYIRLLAFSNDPQDGKDPVEVDTFQFPSACVCFNQSL